MVAFICKVAADKPCTGDALFPAYLALLLWTDSGESDIRKRGKGKHCVKLQMCCDMQQNTLLSSWSSLRGAQISFSLHA